MEGGPHGDILSALTLDRGLYEKGTGKMGTVRYTVINGEVIAEKRNGLRSLYVPDPLGSTVALLDNTQAQMDTFSYWPYGGNDARSGSTATPFQFMGTAGYYRDRTNSIYVRSRTLSTQEGRWTSASAREQRMGANAYSYSKSRPVTPILTEGQLFQSTIHQGTEMALRYGMTVQLATIGRDLSQCQTRPNLPQPEPPYQKCINAFTQTSNPDALQACIDCCTKLNSGEKALCDLNYALCRVGSLGSDNSFADLQCTSNHFDCLFHAFGNSLKCNAGCLNKMKLTSTLLRPW